MGEMTDRYDNNDGDDEENGGDTLADLEREPVKDVRLFPAMTRVEFARLYAGGETNFNDENMIEIDLSQAVVENCYFDGALFDRANLVGSTFRNCTFEEACFDGAATAGSSGLPPGV